MEVGVWGPNLVGGDGICRLSSYSGLNIFGSSGGTYPLGGSETIHVVEQGSLSWFIGPLEKRGFPSPVLEGDFGTDSSSGSEVKAGNRGAHRRNCKIWVKSRRVGYTTLWVKMLADTRFCT